ncbi:MAG: hypothetical protein V3U60_15955 [Gammaproteobacteria bacterium]
MNGPWTDGPRELLQHAADHLGLGEDFDRRIAMISVDNAVELAIKTYLGLPQRARGTKGPGRKELEAASESFPALLDMLDRYAADKLTGVDLGDVEWYHRLRNQLYHSGNGITVERARVEAYFQIALALFENLFGYVPHFNERTFVHTKTGEFLHLWTRFDHLLRMQLPPKDGLAYYWKKEFLEGVSTEAAALWDSLNWFRNNLVHSLETPDAANLDRSIRDLRRLIELLEQRAAQQSVAADGARPA